MSRTMLNFWLDAALAVTFVVSLWLTFVLRFVFPSGTAAQGWNLWGAGYDRWCDLQMGALVVLAVGVLIHVMLHWNWVCGVVTSRLWRSADGGKRTWTDGERTLIGVGLLAVILHVLGAAFAAAMFTVQPPS